MQAFRNLAVPRVARLMLLSAATIPHVNAFVANVARSPILRLGSMRMQGITNKNVWTVEKRSQLSTSSFHPTTEYRKDLMKRSAAATPSQKYDQEQLRLLDEDECILVNERDEVVGHGSKKHCHLMSNIIAGNALHRAFSIFLFNTKGELLLQKRSSDKILFPNRWTNTCCSHPLYNDEELDNPATATAAGVRRAAVRKLWHELGVPMGSVTPESLHYMTRIVYQAAVGEDATWGEHEVDYILIAVVDVTTELNPNEVSEIRYVSKDRLADLLQAETRGEVMLSPWFRLIAQRWLPQWWDALLAGRLDEHKDGAIHVIAA